MVPFYDKQNFKHLHSLQFMKPMILFFQTNGGRLGKSSEGRNPEISIFVAGELTLGIDFRSKTIAARVRESWCIIFLSLVQIITPASINNSDQYPPCIELSPHAVIFYSSLNDIHSHTKKHFVMIAEIFTATVRLHGRYQTKFNSRWKFAPFHYSYGARHINQMGAN